MLILQIALLSLCHKLWSVTHSRAIHDKFSEEKVDRFLVSVLCLLNYTFMLNTYSPGKCCEKVTVPFLDYLHVLKAMTLFFLQLIHTLYFIIY